MPADPRHEPANSFERALVVLETVRRSQEGLTNAEISRSLGIATSTCSYILSRLERSGYLVRIEETGRYCIGSTLLVLAHGALQKIRFRGPAEPVLYWLVQETGLAAGLGVLDRGHVLLVDRLESPKFAQNAAEAARKIGSRWKQRSPAVSVVQQRREMRDLGRELPAHSNALGKAILAYLPHKEIGGIISERGLVRSTPYTILSQERLFAELQQIRLQGYAVSREEQSIGIFSVAAPVFDSNLVILGAVSISGSPADPAWNRLSELIECVKEAGRKISVCT